MSMFTPPGSGAGRVRRARDRKRGLAVLLALLVTAGVVAVAWKIAMRPAGEVAARPKVSCPQPAPAPKVVPAAQVKVNVYNATDRAGLATKVARDLKRRGFRIGKIDNDPSERTVTGAAEVRHSAAGADAARTVAAQVGAVVAVPDQRGNASVDLALGAAFKDLIPVAEAAAALSPSPQPAPARC